MADPSALDIDSAGYIQSGRYAGKHWSSVVAMTETLETALATGVTPPAEVTDPPMPAAATPAEELAAAAANRTDGITASAQVVAERLEQDDETEFITSVGAELYGKYKDKIDALKRNMTPEQRMNRGVHKLLMGNLMLQEPGALDRLTAAPVVPKPSAEGEEEEEVVELVETPSQGVTGDVKPVSPTVKPTPTARTTPAVKVKKSTLKATPKIERAAKEWGMTIDAYLLQLEANGSTQAEIDTLSRPRADAPGRRTSVFDRNTAG